MVTLMELPNKQRGAKTPLPSMKPHPSLVAEFPSPILLRSSRVSLLLRMAGLRVVNLLQPALADIHISLLQYMILTIADAHEGAPVGEDFILSLLYVTDHRDVALELTNLVDRGLLERQTAPRPPHAATLQLTDVGRAALATFDTLVAPESEALSRQFSPEEWKQGMAFLTNLAQGEGRIRTPKARVLEFPK